MHVFRRARIPLACLPLPLRACAGGQDSRIEPWLECDVSVEDKQIVGVVPTGSNPPTSLATTSRSSVTAGSPVESTDLGGVITFPGLLDVHTHLDKAHTWHRAPNPRGEFWDAIKILHQDSHLWTEDDLYRRALFAVRSAYAHGTNAVRTHLDTGRDLGESSHRVMQRLRAEWEGRIALQTVSLCNLAAFSTAPSEATRILEVTSRYRATALGGFPQPNPDLARQYDSLMAAARELGVGLDLHVDESGLAHAECLRAVAEAVLRNQFPHPVACGHTCSLAVHEPARAASTLDLVKQAGIQIIALPLCNLYLQGRMRAPSANSADLGAPRTPRWRGVTLLHEMIEAGVTVACASDNVRDAFFAWGDLDAMEVFQESIRIAHLDTRLAESPAVVTTGPARIMGLDVRRYGLVSAGAPADLVVFPARTFNELLARPAAPRRLIHGEGFRKREIPDYAELDAAL